jgi:hypothetical protein
LPVEEAEVEVVAVEPQVLEPEAVEGPQVLEEVVELPELDLEPAGAVVVELPELDLEPAGAVEEYILSYLNCLYYFLLSW